MAYLMSHISCLISHISCTCYFFTTIVHLVPLQDTSVLRSCSYVRVCQICQAKNVNIPYTGCFANTGEVIAGTPFNALLSLPVNSKRSAFVNMWHVGRGIHPIQ